MPRPAWRPDLDAALASGDDKQTWHAYRQAWRAGASPPMTGDVFCALFYSGTLADEAIELMAGSPPARRTITEATSDFHAGMLRDSDRLRVCVAALGIDGGWRLWLERAQGCLYVQRRRDTVESLMYSLV
jgi:hypothetical protein